MFNLKHVYIKIGQHSTLKPGDTVTSNIKATW